MVLPNPTGLRPRLPRGARALLARLLPHAERAEVLADLEEEYRERVTAEGGAAARVWAWKQVLRSVPALAGRGWWRGWSGFEPRANRWQPGGAMFQSWGQDARYALRRLRHRPTYTALTVLTLALGVAGTAAVYGIARRLLMDPLPFRAEDEVVVFWNQFDWSEAEMLSVRPEMPLFRNVAAWRNEDVTIAARGEPARLVTGISATSELFRVLGVSPALGPGFRDGDDVQGAEPTAVLSHGLWRELGGDPGIIGQRVELDGVPRTITGVMPEGFWFPDPTVRVWLAESLDPESQSGNYALIGRLPPGTPIQGMQGALTRITTLLGERFQYSEPFDKTRDAELTPVREYLLGPVRPSVVATLGAMAVILLIACVNVAALMLGQVDSRGTELAVRTALGAGRRRILQQLVVESLMIGALAGLVGAALAFVGFRLLVGALPLGALAEATRVDWGVFWAAIAIALVAATAVALAPGLSVVRSDLQRWITRSRTGGIGGRGGRLEGGLVVVQVALALLMASGAALLIRSVANLRAIDPGVETEGVAVVRIAMPATADVERRTQLVDQLIDAVEALPDVASAAATQRLPLSGGGDNWGITIEGQPDRERTTTAFRMVTPGYRETMGIRLLSGRWLAETDPVEGEESVVVINRALAEKYFPGLDPLGQRIGLGPTWNRVVGVVDNVAEEGLVGEPVPARYMLARFVGVPQTNAVVIRTAGGRDPARVLEAARRTIQSVAPDVAIQEMTTMEQVFDRALGPARQVMALLAILGGLALALGAIGVYGVVSHFVTRRKRDWGIRIAIGMRPARVVRHIVARGGALVSMGVVLGLAGFLLMARLLTTFLYGVGTADPLAMAAATATLLGAGLLAAYLPARRASRIDPALVLREQ